MFYSNQIFATVHNRKFGFFLLVIWSPLFGVELYARKKKLNQLQTFLIIYALFIFFLLRFLSQLFMIIIIKNEHGKENIAMATAMVTATASEHK